MKIELLRVYENPSRWLGAEVLEVRMTTGWLWQRQEVRLVQRITLGVWQDVESENKIYHGTEALDKLLVDWREDEAARKRLANNARLKLKLLWEAPDLDDDEDEDDEPLPGAMTVRTGPLR